MCQPAASNRLLAARQASVIQAFIPGQGSIALGELLAQSALRQLQLARNSACSGLFQNQFSPESGGLIVGISSKGGYSVNKGIKTKPSVPADGRCVSVVSEHGSGNHAGKNGH